MANNICFLVCENLRREVESLIKDELLPGIKIKVVAFDSACHKAPGRSVHLPKLLAEMEKAGFDAVHVVGSQCISMTSPANQSTAVHQLDSCFSLLCNRTLLDDLVSSGAYLITPGWLFNWRRIVTEWGFDRETAGSFFGECTKEMLLLDTGLSVKSTGELLEDFAAYVNRPARRLHVGVDVLKLHLLEMIYSRHNKPVDSSRRVLADYAMAFDLIGRLDRLNREENTALTIIDIMQILFAPAQTTYHPVNPVHKFNPISVPSVSVLPPVNPSDPLLQPQNGIALSIEHENVRLALITAHDVAMPDQIGNYRNLAIQLASVFGMAVANVRAIETIRAQERQLADEMQIAGAAQRELLQKGFQSDEMALRTIYAPYRWVSGDFFGYSWRPNRRLLRGYLLDVTGHGVATALQTAATSVILNRALVEAPLWNPRLLEELNPQMMQYFSDATFAALMLFEFDLVEAEVRVTGGGIHHFFTSSPTPLWHTVGGSYAGLLPNPDFGQLILPLKRDSYFCFMTDGLSDRLQGEGGHFTPLSYNQACEMLQVSASSPNRWDDCTAVCVNIKGLCAAGECASA